MGSRIYPKRIPHAYIQEWREYPHKRVAPMTQEKLGDRLGVAGNTVGRWENPEGPNGRVPDLNTLAAICEALGIELQDIFRRPETPSLDDLVRGEPQDVIDQAFKVVKALKSG